MKKIVSSHKLRVPIRVRLFRGDRLVDSQTLHVKYRIREWVYSHEGWDHGTVRVTYNREKDYWNEGEFENYEQFDALLSQFTELDLVKDFI